MAGRPSHARALSIWSNGLSVGTWSIPSRGGMELRYDPAWVASPQGRPLSLSLPFTLDNAPLKGAVVQNFFDNLLPDNEEIRRRVAARFRTGSTGAFDLLEAIGRDCVGAVQLLREGSAPEGCDAIDGEVLDEDGVASYLNKATTGGSLGHQDDEDNFRISLAGAQEKTALLWHEGRWMVPRAATPTTHIFKLPLGLVGNRRVDLTTSVHNEWLCLRIMRGLGLPVPRADILRFSGQLVLCVERFDRRLHSSGSWLLRLPQEDFCQALGQPPSLKYEADGGPGMVAIADVLRQSENAASDIETVLGAQIVYWMLAAPDGHAKNFSIHLLPGGKFQLTPLYDVISIWPIEGNGPNQWSWHQAKLAMAIAGKRKHYLFKEIQRRHFNAMARDCGYGADAEAIIARLLRRVEPVMAEVARELDGEFPARVSDRLFAGLRNAADKLSKMDSA